MANLSEKQEAFVIEYISNGGNGTQAAIHAGYAEDSAANSASRMLKHKHVLDRLHVLMGQEFGKHTPSMLHSMLQLARGARSEKVRHDSIKDILDRAGLSAVVKVLNVEDGASLDEADIKARVEDLMRELFDPNKPLSVSQGKQISVRNQEGAMSPQLKPLSQ